MGWRDVLVFEQDSPEFGPRMVSQEVACRLLHLRMDSGYDQHVAQTHDQVSRALEREFEPGYEHHKESFRQDLHPRDFATHADVWHAA